LIKPARRRAARETNGKPALGRERRLEQPLRNMARQRFRIRQGAGVKQPDFPPFSRQHLRLSLNHFCREVLRRRRDFATPSPGRGEGVTRCVRVKRKQPPSRGTYDERVLIVTGLRFGARGRMKRSTAAAKPSSSLLSVTKSARCCTAELALPMATESALAS